MSPRHGSAPGRQVDADGRNVSVPRLLERFSDFTSAVTSSDTVNYPEQSAREGCDSRFDLTNRSRGDSRWWLFQTRQQSIACTWSESGCWWIEEDGKMTPMYG